MSKFTSGKWHIDPLTGEVRANGNKIAKVYGATEFNHTRHVDECMCNARLILNTPEMYTALQAALDRLGHYEPYSETFRNIKAVLRDIEGDAK